MLVVCAYVACEASSGPRTTPSCRCPKLHAPVCGTDNKTYPNKCRLNCAAKVHRNLRVKYEGECKKNQRDHPPCMAACPTTNKPVCGTDNRTYRNRCQLDCNVKLYTNLRLKHNGECTENESYRCDCTLNLDLVCGTDNKTYSNKCFFNCYAKLYTNLRLKHKGECPEDPDIWGGL